MRNFIAMLVALGVRDANKDNQDIKQIANGVVAVAIMNALTKV